MKVLLIQMDARSEKNVNIEKALRLIKDCLQDKSNIMLTRILSI